MLDPVFRFFDARWTSSRVSSRMSVRMLERMNFHTHAGMRGSRSLRVGSLGMIHGQAWLFEAMVVVLPSCITVFKYARLLI